jgi:hypothetical protein
MNPNLGRVWGRVRRLSEPSAPTNADRSIKLA